MRISMVSLLLLILISQLEGRRGGGGRSRGSSTSRIGVSRFRSSSGRLRMKKTAKTGSLERTQLFRSFLFGAAAGHLAYRGSVGVVRTPAEPVIWEDRKYYWDSSIVPVDNESSLVCVNPIDAQDPQFGRLVFPNDTRPREMAWACPKTSQCCGYECCTDGGLFSGILKLALTVFCLAGLGLMIMECCRWTFHCVNQFTSKNSFSPGKDLSMRSAVVLLSLIILCSLSESKESKWKEVAKKIVTSGLKKATTKAKSGFSSLNSHKGTILKAAGKTGVRIAEEAGIELAKRLVGRHFESKSESREHGDTFESKHRVDFQNNPPKPIVADTPNYKEELAELKAEMARKQHEDEMKKLRNEMTEVKKAISRTRTEYEPAPVPYERPIMRPVPVPVVYADVQREMQPEFVPSQIQRKETQTANDWLAGGGWPLLAAGVLFITLMLVFLACCSFWTFRSIRKLRANSAGATSPERARQHQSDSTATLLKNTSDNFAYVTPNDSIYETIRDENNYEVPRRIQCSQTKEAIIFP